MQELGERIQRAYEWDSKALPAPRGYDAPLEFEAIELPNDVLEEYVGEYQLNEQVTVSVRLENGALLAAPAGQPAAPIFAVEIDHFFLRVAPLEVIFNRDTEGGIGSLTIVQGGQRQNAPKLP
jgi:hypothetical protein